AAAAGPLAVVAPAALINWRAAARRRAGRVLWPDLVDHLVSAVRSGLALPDSVVTLAHSGPEHTRTAFAAFEREYRATANFGACLDSAKARLADPVADRILETLRMSREVGGSELTSVLRNLSAYLRQETAIRTEVEARQSWVINAARLGIAAPWVILLLLASRPEAAAAYNTPAGAVLIAAGAGVPFGAYVVAVALGRLPEDGRWFPWGLWWAVVCCSVRSGGWACGRWRAWCRGWDGRAWPAGSHPMSPTSRTARGPCSD